jgi:ferritin-like metal-binding protein YciE
MRLDSLQELFITELQDLYDAENRLVKALPDMADKASHAELQNLIREHLEQTRRQAARLEEVFDGLGIKAKGQKCKGMVGILDEGDDMAGKSGDPAAIDAGIIASAQRGSIMRSRPTARYARTPKLSATPGRTNC